MLTRGTWGHRDNTFKFCPQSARQKTKATTENTNAAITMCDSEPSVYYQLCVAHSDVHLGTQINLSETVQSDTPETVQGDIPETVSNGVILETVTYDMIETVSHAVHIINRPRPALLHHIFNGYWTPSHISIPPGPDSHTAAFALQPFHPWQSHA